MGTIAPGLAVSLFGLALTTRDGLIAGLGWTCLGTIGWITYAALS